MTTKCHYPKCRNEHSIIYVGHPLCPEHWHKLCDGTVDLEKIFGTVKQNGNETKKES